MDNHQTRHGNSPFQIYVLPQNSCNCFNESICQIKISAKFGAAKSHQNLRDLVGGASTSILYLGGEQNGCTVFGEK